MVDIKETQFFKIISGQTKRKSTMGTYKHERMRFDSMSLPQLFTRLGRITQPDKLQMFIEVAGEYGYLGLKSQAKKKLLELTGAGSLPTIQAMQNPIPKATKSPTKPTKPKVETPVVLRRHLEF